MPKPKHFIDGECLNRLKTAIQLKAGVTVLNRPDCYRMSERLKTQFGVFISESTINRLYLSGSNDHHFYIDTLNKLATVIDDKLTWVDYCNKYEETKEALNELGFGSKLKTQNTLLFVNFEYRNWKTLNAYFDKISLQTDNSDSNFIYFELGTQLYRIAEQGPTFELNLYKQFAHNKTVRKAFFEHLADPDFRLSNYAKGLDWYSKFIDKNSNDAANEYCFVWCMKFLHMIKNQNEKSHAHLYDQLVQNFPLNKLDSIHLHPYNLGRLLSVYLIKHHNHDLESFQILFNDIKNLVLNNLSAWPGFSRRIILYYIVYALYQNRADIRYLYEVEAWFKIPFIEEANPHKSIQLFLFEMEPNSMPWLVKRGMANS
jgi:hypothetical protein